MGELVTVTVGRTTDSPQAVTMISRDRDTSDAAMAASYERLAQRREYEAARAKLRRESLTW